MQKFRSLGFAGIVRKASTINLESIERDLVNKALSHARNNKTQAAKLLGLPRG